MALLTKAANVENVTVAEDVIYTAGANKNTIIDSVMFANIHASTETTITVRFVDDSAGVTVDLITGATLPIGSTLILSGLTLEPSDSIRALAGDANVVDASIFMKELDQ